MSLGAVSYSRLTTELTLIEPGLQSALDPLRALDRPGRGPVSALSQPVPQRVLGKEGIDWSREPMRCTLDDHSGRGGGCILRAPGGPVDLDRYPVRGGSRVDQFKRYIPAGAGEQPRALADDHGKGEQGDLVDKLVVEKPADQSAAALHLQLASRLCFQLADGGRDITGEDGRVRPPRVGERGRCDVLGLRVQGRPDRAVARIVPRSPGVGEDLVGPAAEQERVGAPEDLVHDRPGFVVEVGPSAALEYAALILARAAGPLHHSVNGDLRGGHEFHRRSSLLGELVVGWLVDVVTTALLRSSAGL